MTFLSTLAPFNLDKLRIEPTKAKRTKSIAIALANAPNGFCFDINAIIEPIANITNIINANVENTVFFMSFI